MNWIRLTGYGNEEFFICAAHIVMVTPLSHSDRLGANVLLTNGQTIQVTESVRALLEMLRPQQPAPAARQSQRGEAKSRPVETARTK